MPAQRNEPSMHHVSADVVLLDIEGTVGSIDFVAQVLFPYSRRQLEAFVSGRADDPAVQAILDDTRAAEPARPPLATLIDWHDRDVKAPPLKRLQGMIWLDGYLDGAFKAHLYADAVAAMNTWHAAGKQLCIYSSGSRQAQLLYFEHSAFGDLRPLITEYFDTTVGAKTETASYQAIASTLGCTPSRILFLTDNPKEVVAATAASFTAIQIARDGLAPQPDLPHAQSFADVCIDGL